jgi:hypothetical protein
MIHHLHIHHGSPAAAEGGASPGLPFLERVGVRLELDKVPTVVAKDEVEMRAAFGGRDGATRVSSEAGAVMGAFILPCVEPASACSSTSLLAVSFVATRF